MDTGDDYVNTIGFEIIKGRDFQTGSETDKNESVIITKSVVDAFGWKEPIGRTIVLKDSLKFYVAGVIKDVYNNGLSHDKEPLMLRYTTPKDYPFVIVKAKPEFISEVNAIMASKWKELFPNRFYTGQFLNANFAQAGLVNYNLMKAFIFLSMLSVFFASTGVSNLVSIELTRKVKVIPIQRVLGASSKRVLWENGRPYLIAFGVAVPIGIPLSIFIVDEIMKEFWHFFQPSSALVYLVSLFGMFILTFLIVFFKV